MGAEICSVAAENQPCMGIFLPVEPATSQSRMASPFGLLALHV